MRRLGLASALLVVMIAGCAHVGDTAPDTAPATPPAAAPDTSQPMLARYGLVGKTAVEVIDRLDRLNLHQRPADLKASVRPDELLITGDGQQYNLPIPVDRFYLSVAPYIQNTHDCFYHSLTTCKGELAGADVQVRVVDDTSGEVLIDQTRTTFANGFVGLWLPRNIVGTLRIGYNGKAAEKKISTAPDAPTCLTTLQLI